MEKPFYEPLSENQPIFIRIFLLLLLKKNDRTIKFLLVFHILKRKHNPFQIKFFKDNNPLADKRF